LHQRHANFFLDLAEEADPKLRSSDQLKWLEVLGDEHENLRIAMTWLIDSNQPNEAARLVGALGWFWFLRGFWQEGWKWLTKVLSMEGDLQPHLRAKVLYRTGGLEIIRGNLAGRIELVEEALEICKDIGDEEGMAWCLNLLGQASTFHRQDLEAGVSILEESIGLFGKLGDEWGVAWSTRYLGQIVELQGDINQAINLQREALQQFETLGDTWNVAHSLYLLGLTLRNHEDFEEAKIYFQQSFSKCKLVEDDVMAAHALQGLGIVALKTKHYREADVHLRDSLKIMQRIGDENCATRVLTNMSRIAEHDGDFVEATKLQRQSLQGYKKIERKDFIAISLMRLASLAALSGSSRRAACLLGAAEAYLKLPQAVLAPVHQNELDRILSTFQELRGDEIFEQDFADGFSMSVDDAISYALGEEGGI